MYVNNLAALELEGLDGFQPASARLVFSGICQRYVNAPQSTPSQHKEQSP